MKYLFLPYKVFIKIQINYVKWRQLVEKKRSNRTLTEKV
jgi:hypothetical protein